MPTTTSLDAGAAAGLAAYLTTIWLVSFVLMVIMIIGYWKVFTKAGEAGWQSIIPIWNVIVLLKIAGRQWWWILLMLIPIVDIVILAIVYLDIAKSFGHGIGFALGLIFLPFIFWLILGFGGSQYVGPGGAAVAAAPAYTPPQATPSPAPTAPPAPSYEAAAAPPSEPPAPPTV